MFIYIQPFICVTEVKHLVTVSSSVFTVRWTQRTSGPSFFYKFWDQVGQSWEFSTAERLDL